MPKEAKSDARWRKDLTDFARSGASNIGKGRAPPTSSKFFEVYQSIRRCPMHQNTTGRQLSLTDCFGIPAGVSCRCGYHHVTNNDVDTRRNPPQIRQSASQASSERPHNAGSHSSSDRPHNAGSHLHSSHRPHNARSHSHSSSQRQHNARSHSHPSSQRQHNVVVNPYAKLKKTKSRPISTRGTRMAANSGYAREVIPAATTRNVPATRTETTPPAQTTTADSVTNVPATRTVTTPAQTTTPRMETTPGQTTTAGNAPVARMETTPAHTMAAETPSAPQKAATTNAIPMPSIPMHQVVARPSLTFNKAAQWTDEVVMDLDHSTIVTSTVTGLWHPIDTTDQVDPSTLGPVPPNKIYTTGCFLPERNFPPDRNQSQDVNKLFKLADVKGKIGWVRNKGKLDVFLYGPCSGLCIYCGSNEIAAHGVTKAKFCYRSTDLPYEALAVEMKCTNQLCKDSHVMRQRIFRTDDYRYVRTLPIHFRNQLPYLSVGKARGVDTNMISQVRIGNSVTSVCDSQAAAVTKLYQSLKTRYLAAACKAVRTAASYFAVAEYNAIRPFPPMPPDWMLGTFSMAEAFLYDYHHHKSSLKRELLSISTQYSLAADHQRQVVKRIRRESNNVSDGGRQSYVICNDRGLVASYVVVPTTAKQWSDRALKEVVSRRDDPPPILWVDCQCCAGKPLLGKESRKKSARYEHGMLVRLDPFHLMLRIARELNAAHPRYPLVHNRMWRCLYIPHPDDVKNLTDAQTQYCSEQGKDLTKKERLSDQMTFCRKVIGKGSLVADRLQKVLECAKLLDEEEKAKFDESNSDHESIIQDPSHIAFPLITKRVWEVAKQQLVHCMNGCFDTDVAIDRYITHVPIGMKEYRNNKHLRLMAYASTSGTSKCETTHSVLALRTRPFMNLRPSMFDARTLWTIVHFNREKLQKLGYSTPRRGMTIEETSEPCFIVSESHMKAQKNQFLFGTEYLRTILREKDDEIYCSPCGDDSDVSDDPAFGDGSTFNDPSEFDPVDETTNPIELRDAATSGRRLVADPVIPDVNSIFNDEFDEIDDASVVVRDVREVIAAMEANTPRDPYKPRNSPKRLLRLGKDIKSFPPTHNEEMKRVFERCYNAVREESPRLTTDRVTDILEMYAIFQRDEGRKARSTLGDGTEPRLLPLLRISFEHARQYVEELQQLEEAALRQGGSTAKTAAITNEMNAVVRGALDTTEVRDICQTSDSTNGTNVMATGAVASRVNVSLVAGSRKRKVVDNSLRRAGKAKKTRGRVSDSDYLSTLHQRQMRAAQELKRRNETPSKEHLGEKGYIECDVCGNVMFRAPKYHKAVDGHIFAWKKVRWCEYADPVVERLRLEAASRTKNTEWSNKSIKKKKKKLASQGKNDNSVAKK